MGFGLLVTIGKYIFVGLIYLFVIAVFRILILRISAGAETTASRRAATGPRVSHRPPPHQPAPAPAVAGEPVGAAPPQVPLAPAAPPYVARLVVVSTSAGNLASGLSFPLSKSISIGRKSHNDITLHDRYVSATHALIIGDESNHILRDYHSTNGTLHNGTRIKQDMVLRDGDEVTVGTTVFRYQG